MLQELEAKNLPNVSTKVLDAKEMSSHFEADSFRHVFSTFMLQFIPNPRKAIEKTYRVLRPGGAIGVGIWPRKNDPIHLWRDACRVTRSEIMSRPPPYTEVAWRGVVKAQGYGGRLEGGGFQRTSAWRFSICASNSCNSGLRPRIRWRRDW